MTNNLPDPKKHPRVIAFTPRPDRAVELQRIAEQLPALVHSFSKARKALLAAKLRQ